MRPERRALLFDAVLGLLVWGTVSWLITADQAGDRAPDPVAYFWAFGLGCLMLVRRRYPMLILWITVAGLFAYYFAGYPSVGLSVPTAGALLTAAEFLRLRWPVLASFILLGVSYGVRLMHGQDVTRIVGYELVGHLGLMAAAIALGLSLRLRRELQERSAQLVEAVRANERSEAHAALAAERAGIARDLHDSLGHRATVISMHTDVATEALEGGPGVEPDCDAARDSLATVREATDAMMGDLRRTVRTLRRDELPARHPVSLTALDGMAASLPIEVEVSTDVPDDLPAPVEAAAVRIVQESLTNVVRHSAAATAEVSVTAEAGAHSAAEDGRGLTGTLLIRVTDPGPARAVAGSAGGVASASDGGAGIPGMRERAEALGGMLVAAPHGPGFRVYSQIPLADED